MGKKVFVLYRVIQDWRAPVFDRLSEKLGYENLKVLYGPDFEGSKVVSSSNDFKFNRKCLKSLKLTFPGSYDKGYMPISYGLFFYLVKQKPDVVLSEGASNLFNAIQGFLYCKLFRKRFIWWSLGELVQIRSSKKRRFFSPIIQFIEKNSSAILTYSSQGCRYFRKLDIPSERIFTAVNVVDTDSRIAQLNKIDVLDKKTDDLLKVAYAGSLLKSKRLDILLEAILILIEKNKIKIKLNVIGDGRDRPYFENIVKEKKLGGFVHFLGRRVDGFSEELIKNDVLVMPGLGGLAISDAMVHGLAVISGHGDGCEKDLIRNNENGFFIGDMTPNGLALKLEFFMDNPIVLNGFKSKSKEIILKEFNINTYLDTVLKAIEG